MDDSHFDILNIDAEKLISVAEKIIKRHMEMGVGSPLQNVVIADLHSRISHAREKHDEVQKYQRLLDEARQSRDYYLGVQNKSVQLTLKAIISILQKNKGDLKTWI